MYDRNTQPFMIRTTHAVKVDHQICEMCVSGGYPHNVNNTITGSTDTMIDGLTDRQKRRHLAAYAPNAPAKFRTVTR